MNNRQSRRDEGGINLVKISLILGVVAIGYFSFIYVPLILDYFGMKKAVRVGANVCYTNRSVEAVKKSIMRSFKELKMQDEYVDLNTNKVEKTPTPFSEDDIEVSIESNPKQVTVSVHYTRRFVWPFLNEEKSADYEFTHTESLETIKWD